MSFLLQQQLQHKWRCSAISESLVNGQVRFREVRLIGTDGEQLGIMSSQDAQKIADEAELDLVCISPMAKPPVCKIIDYGKYRYEMIRRDKEAKKKQKIVELKEVRLSPISIRMIWPQKPMLPESSGEGQQSKSNAALPRKRDVAHEPVEIYSG